jgi:GxxExxY protein
VLVGIADRSYTSPGIRCEDCVRIGAQVGVTGKIQGFAACFLPGHGQDRPSRIRSLTSDIIKAAVEVHRGLGAGLLESVYRICFAFELRTLGLQVVEQKKVPLHYKGLVLDCGFQIDFLVNDVAIVEIKSVAAVAPVREAQLLTYLRLTGRPVGLLINFNVSLLSGISRLVNTASPQNNLRSSVSLC